MEKKKILMVSAAFFPENSPRSFRTTELVKEFTRQGHEVVLYLPFTRIDFSSTFKLQNLTIKSLGKLKLRDIGIRGNRLEALVRRGLRRLLLLLIEFPDIELMFKVGKSLKKENGYDLLISIAVPHPIHWGIAIARSKKHKISKLWIADCGDPYMGCKTDSFKKFFYFKYVEKWFCNKADFISVPNEDHFGQYYPEFTNKMRAIPQGFRFEDSKVYTGPIKHDVPTFAFAGVLLKEKRDPTSLLKYLASIQRDFKFILYLKNREIVNQFVNQLAEKIEVRPYIRREELLYELSQMDFLLNIEFHSSVGSNSPSKLIDYAITGRPVLSLNMDKLDIQLVNNFLDGDYSARMNLGETDRFRIENVSACFVNLLNE